MANETELNELRERLALLRWDDQLHLFELLLGDYRRRREEGHAAAREMNRAAVQELLESERMHASAAEAKRAAG